MIKRIDLGLNFFGYRETYVPERSWKTIGNELTFVLKNAEDESKEVNSVLQRIETISVLSAGFKQVKKLNIVPFEQELSETEKLIQLQQYLKKKTISVSRRRFLHTRVL